MKFSEIIKQASDLLQQRGRLSYRTLRMEFGLDDEQLDVLKEQLIDIEELAVDKDGKLLVWTGISPRQESGNRRIGESENKDAILSDARHQTLDPRPVSYTPAHLAERIRANKRRWTTA